MQQNAEIVYLDGIRLFNSLQSAYEYLLPLREQLNKINVFPVADYDTGSNLISSLKGILLQSAGSMNRHAGMMSAAIAKAARDEARGNIGSIFFNFFDGFAKTVQKKNRIDLKQFAGAVQNAALSARTAVEKPIEGTILTLLDDWSKAVDSFSKKVNDYQICMKGSLDKARLSLQNTPEQLSVLMKHGVVDAGAQGFVNMLEGIGTFIRSGSIRQNISLLLQQDKEQSSTQEIMKIEGSRTAVVVDSACDLPKDILAEYKINTVPVKLRFGSEEYIDKVTISDEEFWQKLNEEPEHPQTSQPSPGDFSRMFDLLFGDNSDSIISIHIPASVSGTHQSAVTAKNSAPGPVTVIDSENGSIALGLIAVRTAEALGAGLTLEQALKITEKAVKNTKIYIGLASLENVVRGGRLPPAVKKIADLLHITPVLTFKKEGIKPAGIITGRRNLAEKLQKKVRKNIPSGSRFRIGIVHGNNLLAAEKNIRFFKNIPGCDKVFSTYVGPALGVHGGQGCMGIAVQFLDDDLQNL